MAEYLYGVCAIYMGTAGTAPTRTNPVAYTVDGVSYKQSVTKEKITRDQSTAPIGVEVKESSHTLTFKFGKPTLDNFAVAMGGGAVVADGKLTFTEAAQSTISLLLVGDDLDGKEREWVALHASATGEMDYDMKRDGNAHVIPVTFELLKVGTDPILTIEDGIVITP